MTLHPCGPLLPTLCMYLCWNSSALTFPNLWTLQSSTTFHSLSHLSYKTLQSLPALGHFQCSKHSPFSFSCLWCVMTSPTELRQGHRGDFILSLCHGKITGTSNKDDQILMFCSPVSYPLGGFNFYSRLSSLPVIYVATSRPWWTASNSMKRKNNP